MQRREIWVAVGLFASVSLISFFFSPKTWSETGTDVSKQPQRQYQLSSPKSRTDLRTQSPLVGADQSKRTRPRPDMLVDENFIRSLELISTTHCAEATGAFERAWFSGWVIGRNNPEVSMMAIPPSLNFGTMTTAWVIDGTLACRYFSQSLYDYYAEELEVCRTALAWHVGSTCQSPETLMQRTGLGIYTSSDTVRFMGTWVFLGTVGSSLASVYQ